MSEAGESKPDDGRRSCTSCACKTLAGGRDAAFCGECGHAAAEHVILLDRLDLSKSRKRVISGVVAAALLLPVICWSVSAWAVSTANGDLRAANQKREQATQKNRAARIALKTSESDAAKFESRRSALAASLGAGYATVDSVKPRDALGCAKLWNDGGRGGAFTVSGANGVMGSTPARVMVAFDSAVPGMFGQVASNCVVSLVYATDVTTSASPGGEWWYFNCWVPERVYVCQLRADMVAPKWSAPREATVDDGGVISLV